MDREALAERLARSFGDLLGITTIAPTDTPDGFTFALDAVAEIYARQPELSPSWAPILAEYALLDRLEVEFLGMPTKITVDDDSYDLGGILKNVQGRLASLRARIGWIVDIEVPEDDRVGKVVTVTSSYLTGNPYGSGWS